MASLSYGDVTQAGVGTATSVCNGRVVGFGHPMTFLGKTTLTLHPADDPHPGRPGLRAVQARQRGLPRRVDHRRPPRRITGSFGALPPSAGITSSVSYGDRSRTGTSHVSVPLAAAPARRSSSSSRTTIGSSMRERPAPRCSWTITGREQGVGPFSLSVVDRYASDFDIAFDSSFDLANFVFDLSTIGRDPRLRRDGLGRQGRQLDLGDEAGGAATGRSVARGQSSEPRGRPGRSGLNSVPSWSAVPTPRRRRCR